MSQPTAAPDVEYEGKVRARDPETSWDAAAKQTRGNTQRLQDELLALFETFGPMTDDELIERRKQYYLEAESVYDPNGTNPAPFYATPQSIRSRRSELVTAGKVVWTGDKRTSNHGGPSRVWRLA